MKKVRKEGRNIALREKHKERVRKEEEEEEEEKNERAGI